MASLIMFGGTYLIWVAVVTAGVWLLRAPQMKRAAIFALASLTVAYGLGVLASWAWYDPRPFVEGNFMPLIAHAANNGFPSEHTLLASALAAAVTYFDRKWGAALWIMAILIGLSRVAAGIHHFADIAGSAVIAVVALSLAHLLMRHVLKEKKDAEAPVPEHV